MSTVQETTVLNKIRARGYWRVVIRPEAFQEKRIAQYSDLLPIIERNSVQLRGWDYPHVDRKGRSSQGADWVGQECDWESHIEVWRFYQSGLFVHYVALWEDWREHSPWWSPEDRWEPLRDIDYVDTVFRLVEVFEFGARLALSPAGASPMRVEVLLDHLENRRLISVDVLTPLSGVYQTQLPRWEYSWNGAQSELIARPRELAALATKDLFERFGLGVTPEALGRIQRMLAR
jgi:hypothetical protein